ncbi:MAG: protein kinase [Holophagaceae bacterium]
MDLKAGDHFGSYRLVESLGQGGMGIVWKAHDLRLERTVALKVVADAGAEVRQALIAEAKTASRLNHPNIAVVYDAGEIGGVPYIAMEYVEGRTLASMMEQPWTETNLQRVALQAAEGLAHAHERGVVHRDIKPSNLMVTPQGRLEILDFGIAKRDARPSEPGDAATLVRVTAPGLSVGTPAYMSPEQVVGLAASPASDQFSLGLVLYELATGDHPFKQETVVETMHAILKQEARPLREARPDLAPALASAIDRAMAKRAQDRFPDLHAFVASFDATSQSHQAIQVSGSQLAITLPQPAPGSAGDPAPARTGRGLLAGAVGASLLAGLGGGWFLWRRSHPAPVRAARTLAVLPLEQAVPNAEQAWMGTSLADAMTTALSLRGDVMVLDRVWVQEALLRMGERPGQVPSSIQKVARELKADVWILGSYQVQGDRIRVTVRTLDAAKGSVGAQLIVNGQVKDLLAVEDELQAKLPGILGIKGEAQGLDPHSKARNPQTRELFAKASDLASKGNADAFEAAVTLYRKALELEPDYAPARAGLSWSLQGLGSAESHLGRTGKARDHFREAEAEAAKAVSLDPRLAFAHRALAAAYNRLGKAEDAKSAAERAVTLDPADALAHTYLADAYAYEEGPAAVDIARRHYQRALELAPDSWLAHYRYAVLLQNDGELEASVAEARRAAELQPSSESARLAAGNALLWLGRYDEAERELREGLQQVPSAKLLKLALAVIAFSRKDREAFAGVYADLRDAWPKENYTAVLLAGLSQGMAGDEAGLKRTFLAAASGSRGADWAARTASERRGASVNLYFMARSAALLGDPGTSEQLLAAAEALAAGKRKVAAKDPAFRR